MKSLVLAAVFLGIGLITPAPGLSSQEVRPQGIVAKSKTPVADPDQAIIDKAKADVRREKESAEDSKLSQAKTDYAVWSLKHAQTAYEIAVGTHITMRPPHRAGTCGFPAYGSHLG